MEFNSSGNFHKGPPKEHCYQIYNEIQQELSDEMIFKDFTIDI